MSSIKKIKLFYPNSLLAFISHESYIFLFEYKN